MNTSRPYLLPFPIGVRFSIVLKLAGACFVFVLASTWLAAAFVPGDEHWDAQFGWSGPGGSNFAVTTHKGRIYACGGSVGVTNAALEVWDGAQWSVLSWFYASSSAVVYDLAFVGDTLYAAGIFTNVDGVAVTNLARWDGSTWSGVGRNKGTPMALAVDGGNLYVGGTFTNVAGVAMKNVGQWDGSAWHTLGAGLGDTNSSVVHAGHHQRHGLRRRTLHQLGLIGAQQQRGPVGRKPLVAAGQWAGQ